MSSDSDNTGQNRDTHQNEIELVIRALKRNDNKAPVLKRYLLAARWISPAIHPYANLTSIFFTGLDQENTEGDDENPQGSEIDRAEEVKVFEAITKLHPSLGDIILACAGHKRALQNLIHMLEQQSHSARNSDVSSINSSICEFVRKDSGRIEYDKEEFPMPAKNNHRDRGWNHPLFAILLYPMCHHDNLHVDPDELLAIMSDVDNAIIDISESEWPAFLYPSNTSTDLDDDQKGLFRGKLLPIAFRNTFTSPQSALEPYNTAKGRSSKARLHNLTAVTGRTIAYICVLVRIALRGSGWAINDGAFEYDVFYQNIVRMFEEDPEDPWVIDTLAWWNEQIPGLPKSTAGGKKTKKRVVGPNGRISDPIARSAAQRAAKAARTQSPTLPHDRMAATPIIEDTPEIPDVDTEYTTGTQAVAKVVVMSDDSELSDVPASDNEAKKGQMNKRKGATARAPAAKRPRSSRNT